MAKSFSAAIGDWASATPRRIEAVHKRSLEKLAVEMTRTKAEGGNVPFDTGNLYRSLTASTSGLPPTSNQPSAGSNATAVIATISPSQPLYLGYTAAYARRINSGLVGADSRGRVYNQQGNHFVERAIAMWPQIVDESAREVQSGAIS